MKQNKRKSRNYLLTRNYLGNHLGFTVHTANKIIKAYAGEFVPLHEAGDFIQSDWQRFMEWWHRNRSIWDNSPRFKNRHTLSGYSDISEALKYSNGCSDNF